MENLIVIPFWFRSRSFSLHNMKGVAEEELVHCLPNQLPQVKATLWTIMRRLFKSVSGCVDSEGAYRDLRFYGSSPTFTLTLLFKNHRIVSTYYLLSLHVTWSIGLVYWPFYAMNSLEKVCLAATRHMWTKRVLRCLCCWHSHITDDTKEQCQSNLLLRWYSAPFAVCICLYFMRIALGVSRRTLKISLVLMREVPDGHL